jgi:colanic acid/amylovoran biosynthesis glycosyltransferase
MTKTYADTPIQKETEEPSGTFVDVPSGVRGVAQRTVAIFADPLLAPTLTFIPAQGKMMKRFNPCYVGPQLGAGEGLELPPDRTAVISTKRTSLSRLREIPFRLLGWSPEFFKSVKRFSPALVHAHFGPAALEALPLARWLGVPLIANFHGGDATLDEKHFVQSEHYMHRRFWRRRNELMRDASLLLTCSNFIRSELIQKGFPESRIRVHYIGIDTEFFSPSASISREPIVLFVGSLVPSKGLLLLIQTMAEVQKRMPVVELVVIGDGPLREDAEKMASRVLRRCRFFSYKPASSVREWLNRAKVFCMPSHRAPDGSLEGFGRVLAEAQAMELPVVSFATGGIPEAVQDGNTGILCAEGDAGALARNIVTLLENESVWTAMSRAARHRVCREFDLKRCTEKLEDIYESVLEKSGNRGVAERGS